MPHVLWTLQGEKALKEVKTEEGGHEKVEYELTELSKGSQNTVQYDTTVRDLVNFLVYMGEPAATSRVPHRNRGAVRAPDPVRAFLRAQEGILEGREVAAFKASQRRAGRQCRPAFFSGPR